MVDLDFGSGGFIHGEKVVEFLYEDVKARNFEDLQIPLKIVAAEFWSRKQVVFESGELLPAIQASMALPVLFSPLVVGDRVPSLAESIFNTFQIMSKAIVDEKLLHRPPTIYLKPNIVDVQVLEFDRADEIYAHTEAACEELRKLLGPLLESADS